MIVRELMMDAGPGLSDLYLFVSRPVLNPLLLEDNQRP